MKLLSEALLERGFLVEVVAGVVFLTDNAFFRDHTYGSDKKGGERNDLSLLYELGCHWGGPFKYGMAGGCIPSGHLHSRIGVDVTISNACHNALFTPVHVYMESGYYLPFGKGGWPLFRRHSVARKLPLRILDAHVALLSKALSAVGCRTVSVCSGYGQDERQLPLNIEFYDDINAEWAGHLLHLARNAGSELPDLNIIGHRLTESASSLHSGMRDLDGVRRQAIELGTFIYRQRQPLRQERGHWIDHHEGLTSGHDHSRRGLSQKCRSTAGIYE